MFTIREYVKVSSLEEAYELNQKKANVVFGGGVWLRLGKKNIQTAIDLSGLGLDEITEDEKEFSIGCMVSLRQLETHKGIDAYTKGAVKESLRHIVGVQMRNCATVGGSIYGRFGSVTFVSNVIRPFRRHTGAESAPCPHRGSSL